MKKIIYLLPLLSLMSLAGCSSREEADAKMARGCEAAVKVMLTKETYDRQLSSIKTKGYGMSGQLHQVTLNAVTKNKESGEEKNESFICQFEESHSIGFMAWKAALVQLRIGDEVFGGQGGEAVGGVEDQMNIAVAVEAAMK